MSFSMQFEKEDRGLLREAYRDKILSIEQAATDERKSEKLIK